MKLILFYFNHDYNELKYDVMLINPCFTNKDEYSKSIDFQSDLEQLKSMSYFEYYGDDEEEVDETYDDLFTWNYLIE